MPIFLETQRLALRPFTEADVDLLVELHSDPEVMRFINGGRPTSHQAVRTELLPRLRHRFPCLGGGVGSWAALEKSTGRFAGWFALRPLEDHSPAVAELGCRLRRDAWGAGYATEGSRALVGKGFGALGVQRITANTMTVNARSRAVLEKAGLRYARSYFADWPEVIDGSEQGDVEYELTRRQWAARTAGSEA